MNPKIRRGMALGGAVVIVLLWVLTFISAVINRGKDTDLTMILLVASVVVPCLLYVFLRISARLGKGQDAGSDSKERNREDSAR